MLAWTFAAYIPAVGAEIITINLTEEWGKIDVNGEIMDTDFTMGNYRIETMAYSTTHSIEVCQVEIHEDYFVFTWDLVDGAHEEFIYGAIYNKQHEEKTWFVIANTGCVVVPIYAGQNDYDLYCYTGQTVGIIEFDLFDPIKIEVQE